MRKAALTSILTVFLAILIVALLLAPALAATAGFVKTDTTTMGSWIGAYGADGYFVSQDSNTKLPGYAKVTFSGQANWTWAASTTALPALQKPENASDRIAGTWFMWGSFTIDVNLTDSNPHKVALYALDWDSSARSETINVLDAVTGAVLNSQVLPAGSFHNGEYRVWIVQGYASEPNSRERCASMTENSAIFNARHGGGSFHPHRQPAPTAQDCLKRGTGANGERPGSYLVNVG